MQHFSIKACAALALMLLSANMVSAQKVDKMLYDFVVPDNGTFREAVSAANNRADKSVRFRIFVKKGTYITPVDSTTHVLGKDENGNDNAKSYYGVTTFLKADNVSIIGEDMAATVVKNNVPYALVDGKWGPAVPIEGIGRCDLLQISGANTYFQDITLRSGTNDATGRNLALQDKGDKTIYKNVTLWGYQDTWTSNNQRARYYFEGGVIRGRTDYICGKGDAFFNGVTFQQAGVGGYIAVPSVPKHYGWILSNCTIKGEEAANEGRYTLGRPWGSGTPVALWINTKMLCKPSVLGWGEMSGGYPKRFAEYNSVAADGTAISLDGRKTTFVKKDKEGNIIATHTNNPVLTAEEAAKYTIATVMGGDDNWNPQAICAQAAAPADVRLKGKKLVWKDDDNALLWAVVKNGNVVAFTTKPYYKVDDTGASWAVRAANEMGGLGLAVDAVK